MNTLQKDSIIQFAAQVDWAEQARALQARFMQLTPVDLPFIGARIREDRIEVYYIVSGTAGVVPSI